MPFHKGTRHFHLPRGHASTNPDMGVACPQARCKRKGSILLLRHCAGSLQYELNRWCRGMDSERTESDAAFPKGRRVRGPRGGHVDKKKQNQTYTHTPCPGTTRSTGSPRGSTSLLPSLRGWWGTECSERLGSSRPDGPQQLSSPPEPFPEAKEPGPPTPRARASRGCQATALPLGPLSCRAWPGGW